MNIAATKIEIAKQIFNTNNKNLISYIKTLFETQDTDLWDELPDSVKKSAERGLAQADRGEFKSHAEVMKKYKKWVKK
jgi:hypothetical protein